MADQKTEHDRREIIKKGVAAGGIGATALVASPVVSSIGLAPAHAAEGSCMPVAGVWTETCVPSVAGEQLLEGALTGTLEFTITGTGDGQTLIDAVNTAIGIYNNTVLPVVNTSLGFLGFPPLDPVVVNGAFATAIVLPAIPIPASYSCCAGLEAPSGIPTSIDFELPSIVCDLITAVNAAGIAFLAAIPPTLEVPLSGSAATCAGDTAVADLDPCSPVTIPLDLPAVLPAASGADNLGQPCEVTSCPDQPCADCAPAPAPVCTDVVVPPCDVSLSLSGAADLVWDGCTFVGFPCSEGSLSFGVSLELSGTIPGATIAADPYAGTIACA